MVADPRTERTAKERTDPATATGTVVQTGECDRAKSAEDIIIAFPQSSLSQSVVSLCCHREESAWRRGGTEETSSWRESRKEDADRDDRRIERRDRDRRDDRERPPPKEQEDGMQNMIHTYHDGMLFKDWSQNL